MSAPTKPRGITNDSRQIVVGGQRVTLRALLEMQRDSARYRWLRDKADSMACTAAPMVASLAEDGRMIGLIDGEELDAAVDIVMARPASRRATKSGTVPASDLKACIPPEEVSALLRDLERVGARGAGEIPGLCKWAGTVIQGLLSSVDIEEAQ